MPDIKRFPAPSVLDATQLPLATATTQGALSAAGFSLLSTMDVVAAGTVPAFVANAASIAPGTDKASKYPIESTRTAPEPATLTVAITGASATDEVIVSCRALALGYAVSVVNGGSSNTIVTIPASLTKPRGYMLWFDGDNWLLASSFWLSP
jgi:hypothetical protein